MKDMTDTRSQFLTGPQAPALNVGVVTNSLTHSLTPTEKCESS